MGGLLAGLASSLPLLTPSPSLSLIPSPSPLGLMGSHQTATLLQSASNSIASHTKSLPDPGKYPGPLRESRFSRRASGPESVGWRCRDAGSDSRERGHGLRAHPE